MKLNRLLLTVFCGIGLYGTDVVLADRQGQKADSDTANRGEAALVANDNGGTEQLPVLPPVRYGRGYEARADCAERRGKGSSGPQHP